MVTQPWMWAAFSAVVLALLALDLGVFNRRAHTPSTREALAWSTAWITLAALFCGGIAATLGREAALAFAAGYLVEQALSVDNLFVFLVLFAYFRVPDAQRHRVLFWGILGALVMRAAMIFAGAALLERFEWLLYVFGAFLLFTAGRMAFGGGDHVDPSHNPVLRLVRRLVPVTHGYRGSHFFVREPAAAGGPPRLSATPLFVVLALVETTDVVFAVDSIPAVFGVTRDPFIVYTSNVFAILGLRSLFFVLSGVIERFHLLRYGLAAVLAFVGLKMLAGHWIHVPTALSLGVIALALGASVVASLMIPAPAGASPGAVAAGGTDADGAASPPYVTLDSEPLPPNDDLAAVDASAATGHPDVTEAPPRR
jgi:tellurite resistance protein TerC